MVLPFPNVFLAFAEPLLLEPSATPTPAEVDRWKSLSQVTHDALRANESLGDLIASRSRADLSDMSAPGLDEMLTSFGAQVEGVLLLSDSLGRPDDLFAWCFTIRGAYGASLGRFVVPASRSVTQYRDVVDNLTAVVAWRSGTNLTSPPRSRPAWQLRTSTRSSRRRRSGGTPSEQGLASGSSTSGRRTPAGSRGRSARMSLPAT